jgi:hypothetical protein
MKLLLTVIAALLFFGVAEANAADRYWVGGTANWDATAGTKWAATSGGAGGQAVPGVGDNCFFDAASGTVTVTITVLVNCLNLDFTGFTGTLAGTGNLRVSGSLTLGASMTRTYTGTLTFLASSGTHTFTSNGIALDGPVTFSQNVAATIQLGDDFMNGTGALVSFASGIFNANGHNFTSGRIQAVSTGVRTITMGSGIWKVTGTGTVWSSVGSTLTLNNTGSTLVIDNSAAAVKTVQSITGNNLNDIVIASTTANQVQFVNVTAHDIDVQATGASAEFQIGGNGFGSVTLTGDLDFTGFTGSWSGFGLVSLGGSLTLSPTMTITHRDNVTFTATSGTHSITSNTIDFTQPLMVSVVHGS